MATASNALARIVNAGAFASAEPRHPSNTLLDHHRHYSQAESGDRRRSRRSQAASRLDDRISRSGAEVGAPAADGAVLPRFREHGQEIGLL